MYQLIFSELKNGFDGVRKEFTSIPFAPDNTDYQQFVRDIKNGVELKDAEGNQMTPEQITTFLETLP